MLPSGVIPTVKLVTAIVKPHRVDEVKEVLRTDVNGLTTTDEGSGASAVTPRCPPGAEYQVDFVPTTWSRCSSPTARPRASSTRS